MNPEVVGDSTAGVELAAQIRSEWSAGGAAGAFLARHLGTGEQIGFDIHRLLPLASLVKVPIALVVCDRIAAGVLTGERMVDVGGRDATPGPAGISAFRCPAKVALVDLLYLMLAISDNAAADAVLDIVEIEVVRERLAEWGCSEILVRHHLRALYDSVAVLAKDDPRLALELAISGSSGGGSHPLPVLDSSEANAGTAHGLVTFLERLWLDRISTPEAAAEVRRLMKLQISQHRLQAELAVDAFQVGSKTATFLNLRHEIGVVETDTGDLIALAAMTESTVPAFRQPEIDFLIGSAARRAVDLLRM